ALDRPHSRPDHGSAQAWSRTEGSSSRESRFPSAAHRARGTSERTAGAIQGFRLECALDSCVGVRLAATGGPGAQLRPPRAGIPKAPVSRGGPPAIPRIAEGAPEMRFPATEIAPGRACGPQAHEARKIGPAAFGLRR